MKKFLFLSLLAITGLNLPITNAFTIKNMINRNVIIEFPEYYAEVPSYNSLPTDQQNDDPIINFMPNLMRGITLERANLPFADFLSLTFIINGHRYKIDTSEIIERRLPSLHGFYIDRNQDGAGRVEINPFGNVYDRYFLIPDINPEIILIKKIEQHDKKCRHHGFINPFYRTS